MQSNAQWSYLEKCYAYGELNALFSNILKIYADCELGYRPLPVNFNLSNIHYTV